MLPDEVLTTVPAFAPRGTGEVVISVPVRKVLEFRTIPVMDPSAFCLNLPMTGMLSGTTGAAFLGGAMANVPFGATALFSAAGAFAIVRVPGALKRLKVPERCATFFSSTATGALGAGATALGPPPNRLKVPDPCTLFFASATTGGFGGGVSFALKRERVGEGLRTGTGDGVGTAGAGGDACLKKLKAGAGLTGDFFSTTTALRVRVGDLRAGTGEGFGTACGAGLGAAAWKKLNGCGFGGDAFTTTMGSGGGVGLAVFAGVPKNEFRASVIAFGATGISFGTVFGTTGTGFGGDLSAGAAFGEKKKRDAVRRNENEQRWCDDITHDIPLATTFATIFFSSTGLLTGAAGLRGTANFCRGEGKTSSAKKTGVSDVSG